MLADSGSIFVQIGDENVHRVRAVMDEVFGEDNFVSQIIITKAQGFYRSTARSDYDYIIWYSEDPKMRHKFRQLYLRRESRLAADARRPFDDDVAETTGSETMVAPTVWGASLQNPGPGESLRLS